MLKVFLVTYALSNGPTVVTEDYVGEIRIWVGGDFTNQLIERSEAVRMCEAWKRGKEFTIPGHNQYECVIRWE